jgi:hypothetical protein
MKLISPDGRTTRDVSAASAVASAFSADGQTIYGIRQVRTDRLELFSIGRAGGTAKTVGGMRSEYLPSAQINPSTRLSLSPDGKSITYSTVKNTMNLWLAEGLDAVTLPK